MIRLKSLHHARFSVVDLHAAEAFAADFGLAGKAMQDGWLYMHGAGPGPYHYVARQGDVNRLLSIGLLAESRNDLEEAQWLYGALGSGRSKAPGAGL